MTDDEILATAAAIKEGRKMAQALLTSGYSNSVLSDMKMRFQHPAALAAFNEGMDKGLADLQVRVARLLHIQRTAEVVEE